MGSRFDQDWQGPGRDFVYLLDLCTFVYQLHSQTLIWPMDPYYEQWSNTPSLGQFSRREEFMRKVYQVATSKNPDYKGMRGPAALLSGAPQSNEDLDPIISDYEQVNPWRPSVTRPNKVEEDWILVQYAPRDYRPHQDSFRSSLESSHLGSIARRAAQDLSTGLYKDQDIYQRGETGWTPLREEPEVLKARGISMEHNGFCVSQRG